MNSANSIGSAYGRKASTYDERKSPRVGAGTPCGDSCAATTGIRSRFAMKPRREPRQVRILGEDLILFRDGRGRAGLLTPRCAHRGTSLFYGKVDEHGIRCCYHGWQFDVEGRCIDQPCEPGGGLHKERVFQPWYPVEERYGLIFAYLGPPDKRPALPRWDVLETLDPGEVPVRPPLELTDRPPLEKWK